MPLHAHDQADHPFDRQPTFARFLCDEVTKRDSAERRKAAALKSVALLPHPDVTVNTDGSVLVPRLSKHGGGGYHLVDSSGRVHEFADSQIGHLFAWGSSREYARKNMVQALKECSIRGDIRTTVEYLVNLLETPDFIGYNIDIDHLNLSD